MAGFEAAYAGRSLAGLPPELADALAEYSGQSVTLGLRQGKPEALAEALRLLADEQADRAKQLQFLQILGEVRRPACVPVVLRLACQSPDNALRTAALATLAELRRPDAIADRGAQGLCQHVRRRAGRRPELARRPAAPGRPSSSRRSRPRRSIRSTVPREVVEKLLLLGDSRITDLATKSVRPDQAGHVGRASRPDRPAGRRGPLAAPAFPSRASRSSTSSAPAVIPFSAKGARSGPT